MSNEESPDGERGIPADAPSTGGGAVHSGWPSPAALGTGAEPAFAGDVRTVLRLLLCLRVRAGRGAPAYELVVREGSRGAEDLHAEAT